MSRSAWSLRNSLLSEGRRFPTFAVEIVRGESVPQWRKMWLRCGREARVLPPTVLHSGPVKNNAFCLQKQLILFLSNVPGVVMETSKKRPPLSDDVDLYDPQKFMTCSLGAATSVPVFTAKIR